MLPMPTRLMNIDLQMVALNGASGAALIAEAISDNATGWSVGFLIFSVAILNLAKAYQTVKTTKKNKDNEK